jgi:hypothetical protein
MTALVIKTLEENISPGHMALPSGGGRGGSDFNNLQGGKDFMLLLAASNLLVITMKCARCAHGNTEPGSRFHVWT